MLALWMDEGTPFLWRSPAALPSYFPELHNAFLSKCTHCEQVSVWIYDRLVHPRAGGLRLLTLISPTTYAETTMRRVASSASRPEEQPH